MLSIKFPVLIFLGCSLGFNVYLTADSVQTFLSEGFYHHPRLAMARSNVQEKQAQKQLAKVSFLPKIELRTGYHYHSLQQHFGSEWQLELKQNLFNLPKLQKIRLAGLQHKEALLLLDREQQAVRFKLSHSVLQLEFERQKQRHLESLMSSEKLNLELNQQRHQLGLIGDLAFRQAQSQWHSGLMKADLQQLRTVQAQAGYQLESGHKITGKVDQKTPCVALHSSDLWPELPAQSWLEEALLNRPEVLLAQNKIDQERLNEQLVYSHLWPKISLRFVADQHSRFSCANSTQFNFGIVAQWEGLDWLTLPQASDAAMARRLKAEQELVLLHNSIEAEVCLAEAELTQKINALELQQAKCDEQLATWQARQAQAKAGLLSAPRLAQAELEWRQAQQDLEEAEIAQFQAQMKLLQCCGHGLE